MEQTRTFDRMNRVNALMKKQGEDLGMYPKFGSYALSVSESAGYIAFGGRNGFNMVGNKSAVPTEISVRWGRYPETWRTPEAKEKGIKYLRQLPREQKLAYKAEKKEFDDTLPPKSLEVLTGLLEILKVNLPEYKITIGKGAHGERKVIRIK